MHEILFCLHPQSRISIQIGSQLKDIECGQTSTLSTEWVHSNLIIDQVKSNLADKIMMICPYFTGRLDSCAVYRWELYISRVTTGILPYAAFWFGLRGYTNGDFVSDSTQCHIGLYLLAQSHLFGGCRCLDLAASIVYAVL